MSTAKAFKLPKTVAEAVDKLYKLREEKSVFNAQLVALAEQETALREFIIHNLPKNSTGISGKLATATIEIKSVPVVQDWDFFYAYIAKNRAKGSFALLQRRVSEAAVKEILDSGKPVPGIGIFKTPVVRLTKR